MALACLPEGVGLWLRAEAGGRGAGQAAGAGAKGAQGSGGLLQADTSTASSRTLAGLWAVHRPPADICASKVLVHCRVECLHRLVIQTTSVWEESHPRLQPVPAARAQCHAGSPERAPQHLAFWARQLWAPATWMCKASGLLVWRPHHDRRAVFQHHRARQRRRQQPHAVSASL